MILSMAHGGLYP